jgi:hypothetical protein
MDAQFLELFGKMLIQAANSQRQMDQFSNWLRQGFDVARIPGLGDYFQQLYGLADIPKDSAQYMQLLQNAQADFLAAYGEFAGLLGLVPEKKYAALLKDFESLKKKCQAQEEMIANLTSKPEKGDHPVSDLTDQLTDIIEKQKGEFAKTVKSLSTLFDSSKKK